MGLHAAHRVKDPVGCQAAKLYQLSSAPPSPGQKPRKLKRKARLRADGLPVDPTIWEISWPDENYRQHYYSELLRHNRIDEVTGNSMFARAAAPPHEFPGAPVVYSLEIPVALPRSGFCSDSMRTTWSSRALATLRQVTMELCAFVSCRPIDRDSFQMPPGYRP